ncbi:MAG: redoxin family protein [Phycisphaerae bacterium]
MLWHRVLYLAVSLSLVASTVAKGQPLKLGDLAPPLKISEWIKGDRVDLAKGRGKDVYFIEFWATWCPPCIASIPHLTELQRKYRSRGLTVIAVSGPGKGETLRVVKRFVRKRGDSMDYTIAYDGANKTSDKYMGGVGANGIPYAFLIDRSGALVWYGHPDDPVMDEIIDQVIAGKYDASEAILQDKLGPMFDRLNRLHMMRNWSGFTSTAKSILDQDSKNEAALSALVYVYLVETEDPEGLRAFVDLHISAHGDDSESMNALAWTLMGIAELGSRHPDLSLRAATAAYKASNGRDFAVINTYARAVFEIGLVDRALELQEKAVALADGDELRDSLKKTAEFYRKCKALQSTERAVGG